jgi:hypothetical protein
MQFDDTTVPKKSARIAARVIDGQAVIVHPDRRELHTLNTLGSRIWEWMGSATVAELVQRIVEHYEVDVDRARADLQVFLQRLVDLGALEASESRP